MSAVCAAAWLREAFSNVPASCSLIKLISNASAIAQCADGTPGAAGSVDVMTS
jgi:hypothetical protein